MDSRTGRCRRNLADFFLHLGRISSATDFFITKDKKVSRINLVLDHKATNKTLKLWAFITQVIERTYLADNHSKILLVKSEAGDTVSVITSQNLTRGNRHESAFISTDKAIFDRLHE